MIKNENFVAIQGRMVNELGLHGNDLMVYAVINSFTNQDDDHYFHGSLQYLADWCNTSRTNIIRNIKNLVDKGLIEKKEIYQNNVKFCEYRCIPIDYGVIKMRTGCSQNDNGGVIKMITNNIIDNIEDNKEKNINKNEKSFQEFWNAYPKKKGKAKAFEYWCKIKEDKIMIIQKAKEYAMECQKKKVEDKFIKRPQGRLNEKRRNDEYSTGQEKKFVRAEIKNQYNDSDLF